jgi:hypothetical protein
VNNDEAPREPQIDWEMVELAELTNAAATADWENAAEFAVSMSREALRAMRGWGRTLDEIKAAGARHASIRNEGWQWLWKRKPLWRDTLAWVTGERAECPLPLWAWQ